MGGRNEKNSKHFGKNIHGEEEIKHFENSLEKRVEETAGNAFFLPPSSFISFWVGKIWGLEVCIALKTVHFFPPLARYVLLEIAFAVYVKLG